MQLKFGKFKGIEFNKTPAWYQEWLLKQDWFKKPTPEDSISKEMASVSRSLRGWNGYSSRGQAAYDRMFELEIAESDRYYCNCGRQNAVGRRDCGFMCGY